ncbi:MAG TPA: hypothetical protein VGO43_11345 [Pyrinomonadaceae bacterium]|jgi:hypothetical protein|nr:hypothetical protein [Pyrinomonadaceae bacterium]
MKNLTRLSFLFCAVVLLAISIGAQDDRETANKRRDRSDASSPNPAVLVIGSAAKGTWAVTKFATKTVAKPLAKTVFLKAAPAVTKFALKNAAKHALPLFVKLSLL